MSSPIEPLDYKRQRGKLDWLTAYAQPLPKRGRRLMLHAHLQFDGVLSSVSRSTNGRLLAYDVWTDRPFPERFDMVEKSVCDQIQAVETVKVRTEAEMLIFQQQCLLAGHDGLLLHYGRGGYRDGGLAEVRQWTEDLFKAVDEKPGKGRQAGLTLVVCQTTRGHYFDVPSATPKPKVGAKLKVRYAYLAKTGSPVPHLPVAVGWA